MQDIQRFIPGVQAQPQLGRTVLPVPLELLGAVCLLSSSTLLLVAYSELLIYTDFQTPPVESEGLTGVASGLPRELSLQSMVEQL